MNKFEDKFLKTLDEDIFDGKSPSELVSKEGDTQAFNNSMDEEGGESVFNADPAMAGYQDKYIERVKQWKQKITDFTSWLNDPEKSLNQELDDLDEPGTPFEGVSKDSAKKITSIAQDLGALKEILNGVVFSSNQKKKQAQGQLADQEAGFAGAPIGDEF